MLFCSWLFNLDILTPLRNETCRDSYGWLFLTNGEGA